MRKLRESYTRVRATGESFGSWDKDQRTGGEGYRDLIFATIDRGIHPER